MAEMSANRQQTQSDIKFHELDSHITEELRLTETSQACFYRVM